MTSQQASGQAPEHAFTATQRDRQARGKDPYSRSEDEESDDSSSGSSAGKRHSRVDRGLSLETWQDRERRAFALHVLDSPERLSMYAQRNNDSIPGQRRRFEAMLCGQTSDLRPNAPSPSAKKPRRQRLHHQRESAGSLSGKGPSGVAGASSRQGGGNASASGSGSAGSGGSVGAGAGPSGQ